MIIDAHQHFWTLARGDYDWLTPDARSLYRDWEPEHLEPLLAASGVGATVLVQAAATEAETAHLLSIARCHPFVCGVVGWTDLSAPDVVAKVEALAALDGLVGLRPMIQDISDPDWMLQPAVDRGFAAMERAGLVFDALVYPLHLSRLEQLADRHPGLAIILDHAGKPDIASGDIGRFADAMHRLSRRRNVACKMSHLRNLAGERSRDEILAPWVDQLIAAFGPDRLMWGSDWPVLLQAGEYRDWLAQAQRLTGHLSPAERDKIFGATAVDFYKLEFPA